MLIVVSNVSNRSNGVICIACVSQDEEKLIKRELAAIKEQVSSPNTTMVS